MSDRKILVADYNTRELQHMKKLFTEEGFEVITVQDGKTALDKFFEVKPDIVLLSAMLSKINGFDVCKQIKDSEEGKAVPVILATSVYKGQKYRIKAIHEHKASEFIEKPVPDIKLLEAVRQFAGDTRSLIASKRAEYQAKQAIPVVTEPAPKPPAPPVPPSEPKRVPTVVAPSAPPRPVTHAQPQPAKVAAAKPARAAKVTEDNIDRLLKDEITSSLLATETKAEEPEESMDKLLSDTLSGLGITLDSDKKKPAPAEVLEKTVEQRPPAPIKPDTGELKLKQIEEDILKGTPPPSPEKLVEKYLMSFDTDLEKKLSDTLSGVGLSDTNIGKVFEAPQFVEPEPAELEKEGTKFGDYILIEKIGHGGMAELYRAKKRGQAGFQKIVAIKRILPNLTDNQELVTMFIDEAKIAAQLSHQNIANIFDFGKIEKSYYIAMEYVDGFDLKKILSKAKEDRIRFPHKLAAYIALQICSALDYAHHKKDFSNRDLNIVHRDVSPQNILISREGEVKLVDFGISKAESKIHHTVKGALKGKLLYMSPEQAWGKEVDKRSDLYSLGIALCEMVSGKVLFEDSSEFDVLEKVRSGRIPLLENEMPGLPPRLKVIVDRALQIDPHSRYQTAAVMAKDLHDYLNLSGPVPSPKDLRQFITRLFPDEFGLKEQDVRNLSLEEFMEKPETVTPRAMSEETVLLESEEMAGLQDLAVPIPVSPAQASKPVAKEELIWEDEEIVIESKAAPAPAAKKPGLEKKPEQPKPGSKKAEAKKPPEPKKATAAEVKKPPEVKKPAEPKEAKKAPPKLVKETEVPAFMTKEEKKGKSKTFSYVVLALLLVAAGAAAYYMFFIKKHITPPPVGNRQVQQEPVSPSPTPAQPETTTETREQPTPTQPSASNRSTPAAQPTAGSTRQVPSPTTQPPRTATQPSIQPTAQPTPTPAAGENPPAGDRSTPPQADNRPAQPQPAPEPPKQTTSANTPTPPPVPKATEIKPAVVPMSDNIDMTPAVPTSGPTRTGDIVALTPDVKQPQLLKQVDPHYPELAKRNKIRGNVIVSCRILVSHTGSVEKVVVVSSNPPLVKPIFSPEVEAAVSQWKYTPAEKDGVKVKVWITRSFNFKQ